MTSTDASATAAGPELTVLMPCLDEAETLRICIDKAHGFFDRVGVRGEVLIADNGSTDGSQDIARSAGARVIDVPIRGYGAALLAGIEDARGTYVVMGDADDSYDFAALDPFLDRLRDGADLVMGNRFLGGIEPGAMPPLHKYLGNPVLSRAGRIFYRTKIGDFHCGLRGFRRDSALALDLRTTGMEFASEFVVKASLMGQRIDEVPTTLSRDGRSRPPHLHTWRDGWRHLRFLLLYSPRWLFVYPGLALFGIGLVGLVLLGTGLWRPGRGQFSEGLLVAAGGLMIVGFQMLLFGVLARQFAATEGLLPPAQTVTVLSRRVGFGAGLIAASLVVAVGIIGLVTSLVLSTSSDPQDLQATTALRLGICSVVLCVLGVQLSLGSTFLSILGLRRVDSPAPILASTA